MGRAKAIIQKEKKINKKIGRRKASTARHVLPGPSSPKNSKICLKDLKKMIFNMWETRSLWRAAGSWRKWSEKSRTNTLLNPFWTCVISPSSPIESSSPTSMSLLLWLIHVRRSLFLQGVQSWKRWVCPQSTILHKGNQKMTQWAVLDAIFIDMYSYLNWHNALSLNWFT